MAQIPIPNWDDIVHIKPRPKITKQDWSEYHKAKKEGRTPNLPQDKIDEIDRRLKFIIQIQESKIPHWQQALTRIVTHLDNIEDGIVTACVIGRILAKIAPRVLGRLIPIVGWAFLAADVLTLAEAFLGIPGNPMFVKRLWDDFRVANPKGWKHRARFNRRLARALPTIGELVEIAQTTDQLFGVGLCLGPIFGCIQEAMWSTIYDLKKYAPVLWKSDEEMKRAIELEAAAELNCLDLSGSLDEFERSVYVAGVIAEDLEERGIVIEDEEKLEEYTKQPIQTPPIGDTFARWYAEDVLGEDPEERNRFPIPGAPKTTTIRDLSTHIYSQASRNAKAFIDQKSKTLEAFPAADTMPKIAKSLYRTFGNEVASEAEKGSEFGEIYGFIVCGLFPTEDIPEDMFRRGIEYMQKEIDEYFIPLYHQYPPCRTYRLAVHRYWKKYHKNTPVKYPRFLFKDLYPDWYRLPPEEQALWEQYGFFAE